VRPIVLEVVRVLSFSRLFGDEDDDENKVADVSHRMVPRRRVAGTHVCGCEVRGEDRGEGTRPHQTVSCGKKLRCTCRRAFSLKALDLAKCIRYGTRVPMQQPGACYRYGY
jgi:hypothetical protein